MRKGNGFTLIELLIVLAILGILVGIVAMSVGDLTTASESRAVDATQQVAQGAIHTISDHEVLLAVARVTMLVPLLP